MTLPRMLILAGFLLAEFAVLTLDHMPFAESDSRAGRPDHLPVLAKHAPTTPFAAKFEDGTPPMPQGSIIQSNVKIDRNAAAVETQAFVVLFDFDSSRLSAESEKALDAAVAIARRGEQIRVFATGHADASGPPAYNLTLSHQRVEAVRRAFLERGVPAEQIDIEAFGQNRPRIATPDGSPESRNRRVEIIVGPAPNI
ncbi:MAG: OmpA family protein [Rhodospirillales bacterium]